MKQLSLQRSKLSSKKGFTLMELLIVVAIIAVLVAIMIPTFSSSLTKATDAADDANMRSYSAEVLIKAMTGDGGFKMNGENVEYNGAIVYWNCDKNAPVIQGGFTPVWDGGQFKRP